MQAERSRVVPGATPGQPAIMPRLAWFLLATLPLVAADVRDGAITPVCTPASGSTFPLGTTTVTCTATDKAGNAGTATLTVTVAEFKVVVEVGVMAVAFVALADAFNAQIVGLSAIVNPDEISTMSLVPIPAT